MNKRILSALLALTLVFALAGMTPALAADKPITFKLAMVDNEQSNYYKGAQAIAAAIYLLRTGADKGTMRDYLCRFYDLDFTLDEIRPAYQFEVSCQKSVPQAIVAFLEADSYEDTLRNALSLGGDADTLAAMAGSIAEACYPIPEELEARAWEKLTPDLQEEVLAVRAYLGM